MCWRDARNVVLRKVVVWGATLTLSLRGLDEADECHHDGLARLKT